ncbi:uncharacterized protein IL334_002792 [Kwoniella shivajii]|uniref:Splicing factor YJU2 n=1 Tax=Kwoniella shivajii TaxID=564305 RepID=A0ABZ1CYR4_9TREE|nr:hypothetical protein IL334_002792 [Kwoniella shivajii]
MPKDPQQVIRLMAPFSMRCNRCGEYVYKGKKFNARKETAQGEEYYGIKIFRFYIKCPMCSSEITFKTDPKNADYTCEQGATRNFENWSENSKATHLPGAEADDEYDSDGNPLESKIEKDAMADLERSQEQSRREMEAMDELADLRQRNARLELSNVSADPDAMLAALHAERVSVEEENRRKAEEDEDDALVKQFFSKVPATGSAPTVRKKKSKPDSPDGEVDGLVEDQGSEEGSEEETALPAALTIKRRPAPGNATGIAEPSVASILAAKGKVLDGQSNGSNAPAAAPAQAKRKREGMQKLLGIKKKAKA